MKTLLITALLLLSSFTVAADDHTDTAVESAGVVEYLNDATEEELIAVSGIGEALAARIVSARPFTAASEILAVKGIGEAKARSIQIFALTVWENDETK